MDSTRMPSWLRMVLVAGVVVLVAGAGLFGYRWYSRPTTLTIAVGSLDGEATKLMSALASRLAAANAPVRLKLVETTSALEAAEMFSSNKTDLAVVRGDVGDLSQAQAVIVVPLAEKYLALLRGLFLQNPKTAPVLIPIEAAGAIAEKHRAYESFDVPK